MLSAWLGGWGSPDTLPEVDPTLERVSLQEAFAVFFPAATGLMVGVGMSGSLARPRHSIPRGILTAWCASLTVYLITACWLSAVAEPDELLANKTIMISKAAFGPLVLVGVLCTTIMAAVSNMVAAPRLLQAMAAQRVVPFGNWIERPDEAGQPRRALSISLVMVGAFLLSGSLDQIAKIVTAFFILTYMAINLVVFLEQRLGMISFRPTLVHSLVPPMGLAVCAVGLFVSSPTMGLSSHWSFSPTFGCRKGNSTRHGRLSGPESTFASPRGLLNGRVWRADLSAPGRPSSLAVHLHRRGGSTDEPRWTADSKGRQYPIRGPRH